MQHNRVKEKMIQSNPTTLVAISAREIMPEVEVFDLYNCSKRAK